MTLIAGPTRVRAHWLLLCLTTLVCTLACEADPVPKTLTVSLISPNGPEGVASVTLVGSGIAQVSALDARTFSHVVGETRHVVVVRDQPGEIRFQVALTDAKQLPVALVVEVAGGDNRLRTNVGSYRLEFRP